MDSNWINFGVLDLKYNEDLESREILCRAGQGQWAWGEVWGRDGCFYGGFGVCFLLVDGLLRIY